MTQNFRHRDIVALAKKDGAVTVDGLAQHFGVTLQTIRRDLSELADAGHLERVHGGAVLPSATTNIGYAERRHLNLGAKTAMAKACIQRVPQGASIFMNIGTSTEAVAKELQDHEGLLVVTNNMNVANILASHPDCEVVVTVGQLRRTDGGLVGPMAVDTIQKFKFDLAIIGCSALDADGDLLDFDIQEVGVSQAILGQARSTFLVADASKLQRSAPARIASLQAIDVLFTDADLPKGLLEKCADWDTEIVRVHP